MKTFSHLWQYLVKFFLEREMFYTKVVQKIKTRILYSIPYSENRTVYEIMSKNMVQAEGPQMTSRHGSYALHAGRARLRASTRMHTPTRSGTHTHARTDQ
jgi:hypothetical protein